MARGDKNYDKRTHAASKKDTKGKQKEVWDMVGSKKKLHEMVEALINGDSKAAAASLHDYLQVKTRAVLGETDEEGMDDEMVADRHEDDGEEGHDHEDGEEGECPECHCDPCECEGEHDGEEGDEDFDADEEFGGEGEDDHEEHGIFGEGADGSKTTRMKKLSGDAKHLPGKISGNFESSKGTKSDSSGARKTAMKKLPGDAKDLARSVKGNIKFDKKGKAKLTKPFNNAAPGLDRKVKGKIKY